MNEVFGLYDEKMGGFVQGLSIKISDFENGVLSWGRWVTMEKNKPFSRPNNYMEALNALSESGYSIQSINPDVENIISYSNSSRVSFFEIQKELSPKIARGNQLSNGLEFCGYGL